MNAIVCLENIMRFNINACLEKIMMFLKILQSDPEKAGPKLQSYVTFKKVLVQCDLYTIIERSFYSLSIDMNIFS